MDKLREVRFSEFRAAKSGDGKSTLDGYAAVFNQPSQDLGGFIEVIKPGAFSRTLGEGADVRALFNHDPNIVIGRSKDGGKTGTLILNEDVNGLHYAVEVPDTQAGRDLLISVDRGDISQCSFGFFVREQNWNEVADDDGDVTVFREILDVDLIDVSVVTYPAYPQTSVEARALMFPKGAPVPQIECRAAKPDTCECDCPECTDDRCEACSNSECMDDYCACQERSILLMKLTLAKSAL